MKTNMISPRPVVRANGKNRDLSIHAASGFPRGDHSSTAITLAAMIVSACYAGAQAVPNPNTPLVNGLFYGDGDSERYVLIAESPGGSKLYGYFDTTTSRYYSALVVDRAVNDNVVGNKTYTDNAGWNPAHPFNRIVDSEFMGFTLSCGSQSWTWKQGYAAQPDSPRNVTNPTWFSSHEAGAGTGTPPPGYVSSSSMVWNLNNHAAGNSPSWDVTQGGTLAYNDWKSPFAPASPNTVIGLDGYPATGKIGFSQTHGWEWAMVYEFSVDLSSSGPNPIRLMNISSHHSPAKSGGEDDPIKFSDGLFDWGDLPAPYPTTKAQNGPRHELVPGGAFLGSIPSDIDLDGKPDFSARGDDLMNLNDEDGIRFLSPVTPGKPATVKVTAGTAGYLSAWIDFNGDGTLTKVNLLSSTGPAAVTPGLVGDRYLAQPGVYQFTISVPSDASGRMYSRWRYTNQSGQGGNSISGYASTGEVEDHALSAIGDFVWNDTNGNGLQDNGEPGISGVTVRLLDGDGNPVTNGHGDALTAVTGSNGKYLFTGLPVGTYQIEVECPEGYLFTRPDADSLGLYGPLNSDVNPITGRSTTFQLATGDFNMGIDAGLFVPGSIAGAVYFDSKGDHHGDTPMAGVKLCLADASGEPVCDPHDIALTTTTCEEGCYSFTNLPPGHYQVVQTQPEGYFSVSDVDGGDLDVNGDVSIITLGSGQDVTGQDFVESQLTTLSGRVFVNTVPLAGVTLTLIDRYGNPVDGDPETPGIQPITTVTDSNGYYVFHGVPAGTYMIGQTRPYGYLSFGDADGGNPDLIGDVSPIVTLPGQHSEDNDFILTLNTCPDDWNHWKFLHPEESPEGNPDADGYDNLAEFAFAMPYDRGTGSEWLGSTAWVIQPSTLAPGTIEAVFVRPKGAHLNVTYTLQYAATLGSPTVWQETAIASDKTTTVDNGDCTETVTIHDLETLTGLTGGAGFVRIKAVLDDDGGNNGDIDHTTFTEVEGWTCTDLEICCQTYNVPYQRETAFTGTISDANGDELAFADADSLDTLLASGGSYYMEITSGNHEGQRFEIVSASGNTLTVAGAAEFQAASPSIGSLAVLPPSSLVGDTVAVRRHWTLDEVYPPAAFGSSNTLKTADEVQIFHGGAWSLYWLYSNAGSPMWIKAGADSTLNQGNTVIPPGQGMFFNNRHTVATIVSYGEVRTNNFVRPLEAGNNLVGGGYPVSQSANGSGGRAMNIATGFFGSRDFKTADSIFIWKADTLTQAAGYDTYYLADARSIFPDVLRWVKVGDPSLTIRDSEVILHGNRAAFVRSREGVPQYTSPSPWTP
jgi:uncharacterized protein (TIGR02597 family)